MLKKIVAVFSLPCVILILFLFRDFFKSLANYLPTCMWYTVYGVHCPGCGVTRAVLAILSGDILLAFRENAILMFSMIAVLLFYLQCVFRVFGKKVRFFPKSILFWVVVAIAFILYVVLRNVIPGLAPI